MTFARAEGDSENDARMLVGFERFLAEYRLSARVEAVETGSEPARAEGWAELLGTHAGATFEDGLYRLHTPTSPGIANAAVAELRPDFEGRVACGSHCSSVARTPFRTWS